MRPLHNIPGASKLNRTINKSARNSYKQILQQKKERTFSYPKNLSLPSSRIGPASASSFSKDVDCWPFVSFFEDDVENWPEGNYKQHKAVGWWDFSCIQLCNNHKGIQTALVFNLPKNDAIPAEEEGKSRRGLIWLAGNSYLTTKRVRIALVASESKPYICHVKALFSHRILFSRMKTGCQSHAW